MKYSRAWRPPSTWTLDLGLVRSEHTFLREAAAFPLTSHTGAGRAPPNSSGPSLPWNNPGAGRKRARPRPQARSPIPGGPPTSGQKPGPLLHSPPWGARGPWTPGDPPSQAHLASRVPMRHQGILIWPILHVRFGQRMAQGRSGGPAAGNRGAGERRTRPPIHMQLRNPRNVRLAPRWGQARALHGALHGSPARKQASPGSSPSSRKPSLFQEPHQPRWPSLQ